MTNNKDKNYDDLLNKLILLMGDPNTEGGSDALKQLDKELRDPNIRATFISKLVAPFMEVLNKELREAGNPEYLQISEIISFRSILSEESDRGCALMAAAYLDDELKKLIRARLINKEGLINELFQHNRALGSFSSRIDFAYAMGLISASTRSNLNILRKIRNEFAHVSAWLSFETHSIASRCRELKGVGLTRDSTPRAKFIRCMMLTAGTFHFEKAKTSHIEEKQDSGKLDDEFEDESEILNFFRSQLLNINDEE